MAELERHPRGPFPNSLVAVLAAALALGSATARAPGRLDPAAADPYAFRPAASGERPGAPPGTPEAWVADNPAHGYRARVGPDGALVELGPPSSAPATLPLRVVAFGPRGHASEVAPATLSVDRRRVELMRRRLDGRAEPLVEWYANGPLGLQQGFILTSPPDAHGRPDRTALAREVEIQLEIPSDWSASVSADRLTARLASRTGSHVLDYTGLVAWDADGRPLRPRLALDGSRLAIEVDTTGATFPVTIDPWVQRTKLTAKDGLANDLFGAVALSGDVAVVGATNAKVGENTQQGAAYVFVRTGTGWAQQFKLTASDGAATDHFGDSVAISGDTIIVGAPDDSHAQFQAGSAYVYVRSGDTWAQQAKLVASDPGFEFYFGWDVAIDGDTVVVGAHYADVGSNIAQGAAYVFTRSGTSWHQQARLTALGGAAGDHFGSDVTVSGDTAAIGAAARAASYVFARTGDSWSQQQRIDGRGTLVALSGSTLVLGSPAYDVGNNLDQGAAFVFVRTGSEWTGQAQLTASDGEAGDRFGQVDIDRDTVVVGAGGDDIGTNADQGSAYAFVRSGTQWTQQGKVTALDGAAGDAMGEVAVDGRTALVGVRLADVGGQANSGAAYVFEFFEVPTVTDVSPPAGPIVGATRVTITGTNFAAGNTTVTIGGLAAADVTVTGTGSMSALTPAHPAGAADVVVTTPGGSATLAGGFSYLEPPTLTGVSPNAGPLVGGTTVTLTGTGFFAGGTSVRFGATPGSSVTVTSPTSLTVRSPAHAAGTVDVQVTTPGGSATLAGAFTYRPGPTLTGVSPAAGPIGGGTRVTLTGANFVTGATTVRFGATPAIGVTVTSATSLTATTPMHPSGAVSVSVTTAGGSASLADGFTFRVAPSVTEVSPSGGATAGGTTITVTGTAFVAGGTSVSLGGTAATAVTVTSATSLTAVTPAHAAGAVDIVVTTAGGPGTLPDGFTYLGPPSLIGMAPRSGPLGGGTTLTISGKGLVAGATVSIGGAVAAKVVLVDAATLRAVTPRSATIGARDVSVTTPGGTATLRGAFTYTSSSTSGDQLRNDAGEPVTGRFTSPALSADGRYLAFVGLTAEGSLPLVAGDTNRVADVFVRDRRTRQVVRVSIGSRGEQANGPSGRPRISATGRFVAFWSDATNLVPGDTNGMRDVFVHDRDTDADGLFDEADARSTVRVSVASGGAQANGPSALDVSDPASRGSAPGQLDLSPDGLWVAFRSEATNLVAGDTNKVADIFLHSRTSRQTTRVSVGARGVQANGPSQSPGVSAAGRRIVFASEASNLVARDTNGVRDVFVIDRVTGQVVRLSEPAKGVDADGPTDHPSIDDAGVVIVAQTRARNLVPALAGSAHWQIVSFTLQFGESEPVLPDGRVYAADAVNIVDAIKQLVSGSAATGQPGNGDSTGAEVSGSGTAAGYTTGADDLTPDDPDTNGVDDVVVQQLGEGGEPERVSKDSDGNEAVDGDSTGVALDEYGSVVAVESEADLTPESATNADTEVFEAGTPLLVSLLSPASARTDVSDIVAITGAGFQPGVQVLLGATAVETIFDLPISIRVRTPAGGAAGVVDVTVRNPDGTQVVLPAAFTFLAPSGTGSVGPLADADGDGLPDEWEQQMGLLATSATGDDGAQGDPDADGVANLDEYQQGTHPRGLYTRYLAEGATSAFFDVTLALLNPTPVVAQTVIRFLRADGHVVPHGRAIAPEHRETIWPRQLPGLGQAEFATVVESSQPLVVDRTMKWDQTGYGGHAETSVAGPSATWYLAEGATHSDFALFYLLQNPHASAATVEVTYLLPSPAAPIARTYVVAANSRFNIWVNTEDVALQATDVSAVIEVTEGPPIIVERAMYRTCHGQYFGAGHGGAGITQPATQWFLAEGATGDYFDLFVLVANPQAEAAEVEVRYLRPDGNVVVKQYVVPGQSRFNIWVDHEDPALADTAVSMTVTATNDVPVLVERAMWWPGRVDEWFEAHNAAGATTAGFAWALAEGAVDAALGLETYVLVANTGSEPTDLRVTAYFETGAPVSRTFAGIAPQSRFNVPMGEFFPETAGQRFGVVVERTGEAPQPIVVERAMYWDAPVAGEMRHWAAGTSAAATRIR